MLDLPLICQCILQLLLVELLSYLGICHLFVRRKIGMETQAAIQPGELFIFLFIF